MLKTFFYLVTVNAFQIDLWKQNKEIFFITMKIWNNNKKKNLFVKPNIPIFPSFFVLSTPFVCFILRLWRNHFTLWKWWTVTPGYVDSSGYLQLHVQFFYCVPNPRPHTGLTKEKKKWPDHATEKMLYLAAASR